jgi:phenylalanyl-tRNA synthetase alpha chain
VNLDVTVPTVYKAGKIHPLSQEISNLHSIMGNSGFVHAEGPSIEDEEHNFDALNVDKMHPARDSHDTFYLLQGGLLRTHTSSVQIRIMETQKYHPPFSIYHLGRVYRKDLDQTHSPMFHQLEGLVVGDLSFAHLKGAIEHILSSFFGEDLTFRYRPSYFPFTSPSVEVDIQSSNGWMEVLGAGMVKRNILERYQYTGVTGYAFGFGVERLVMLKRKISNLHEFYRNRFPFLRNNSINHSRVENGARLA